MKVLENLFKNPFHLGATIRTSSICAVDQCDSSNQGSSCSSQNICYRFETSQNTTLCAPQVQCSFFDLCSSTRTCSSNNSVCVLNSCCSVPVCMPLALNSTCSSSASNVSSVTTTPSTQTTRMYTIRQYFL